MNDEKMVGKTLGEKTQKMRMSEKRTLYITLGVVLLGLLLPRATVYKGLMPFGIGLAAAVSGTPTALVYLSTCVGYLLCGTTVSLRYLAALAAVFGMRWAVSGFRTIARLPIFQTISAFIALLITGSALQLGSNPSITAVLIVVAESLLGGGFTYFSTSLWHKINNPNEKSISLIEEQVSVAVVVTVTVMALLTLEVADVSPGRILCGILILLSTHCAGVAGISVGALMGVAVLLSTPHMIHLAPAFALGGVLSASFTHRGKWLASCMYVISFGIATVQADNEVTVIVGLYEALVACIVFMILPVSIEKWVERHFHKVRRLPEVDASRKAVFSKMTYASHAIKDVVDMVDAIPTPSDSFRKTDIGTVCRECAEEICHICKKRSVCWGAHFSEVMDSINHIPAILRQKGEITTKEISGYLQRECAMVEKITSRITAQYREFSIRDSYFRRLQDLRGVINDQFLGTSAMLSEFAKQFVVPEVSDVETEKRIGNVLEKEKISFLTVSCRVNERGRMTVELLLKGKYRPHNNIAFQKTVSALSDRTFALPMTEYADNVTRITFLEQPGYRACVATAQLPCKGESLCGDSYELFRDNEGRELLILSDGMGSGGDAAADSAVTAALAMKLLKAGFGYESTLKMINTVLLSKTEDERLATLDVVDINLYSGAAKFLKAGAGASLLYSNGRVSRIEEVSLPLGILRELTYAQTDDRLTDGDILITMSDGVSNEGLTWVEEQIKKYVKNEVGDLQMLADTIAAEARKRQANEPDDITVLVAQLKTV